MGKKKRKPANSKMTQVAELFGKQLGEEFKIRWQREEFTAVFYHRFLRVNGAFRSTWGEILMNLLSGEAEIVEEVANEA